VRARLFWKLGLTYLGLLLIVLFAAGLYSSYILRRDYIRSADHHLASLLALAEARSPAFDEPVELRAWADWVARSGARVTVIGSTGNVLVDSSHDAETAENDLAQPEVQQALAKGSATSIRRSVTLGSIFVYHAETYQRQNGSPLVIRMSLPLSEIDASAAELQRRVLSASLLTLLIGGMISLAYFRKLARRIERLMRFAHQIADGDFRPLPGDRSHDELADLASALNEAASRMDRSLRSLAGERNRSGAILRSMVEGVAVVDAEERLVFFNRAFSESLNLDPAEIEGRSVIEVVRNSDLIGLIRRALKGEEGLRADISVGIIQQLTFSVSAAPVQALEAPSAPASAPGITSASTVLAEKPSGAVVVLHDVTELRRLERVRQDFVANVSHEFKTPLTAIQGFAETLLIGALEDPDHNRRFLEIIRDHAARLATLTDDLLKLARIEAGKLEVDLGPVNLLELIERCAEVTLLKASQKQIALETDVPPGMPAVRGDASLLREVLQNLLDNAVQYTPPGGRIKVTAMMGDRKAIVAVEDTGIGIPLVDQERIFERFYRVDAGRSREAGGTGLGLSIAKHIVEVHGGQLRVESEIGHGSKFSFSLSLVV
jgi:two-component system, OmpR family, phosphate regulon sensor histidine kinase PhoR